MKVFPFLNHLKTSINKRCRNEIPSYFEALKNGVENCYRSISSLNLETRVVQSNIGKKNLFKKQNWGGFFIIFFNFDQDFDHFFPIGQIPVEIL